MTIYDIAKKHAIPAVAVTELESVINALHTDHAAELQQHSQAYDQLAADHATYVANATAALTATGAAIADPELDAAATVSAITAIVADLTADETTKKKSALEAEIKAKQAELEALAQP